MNLTTARVSGSRLDANKHIFSPPLSHYIGSDFKITSRLIHSIIHVHMIFRMIFLAES